MSVRQGDEIAHVLKALAMPWNAVWKGRAAVMSAGAPPAATLDGGMKLTLLSPRRQELERLARHWDEDRRKRGVSEAANDDRVDEQRDVVTSTSDLPQIYLAHVLEDRRWANTLRTLIESSIPDARIWSAVTDTAVPDPLPVIEATTIAVVLVSSAALASKGLMEGELPAMIAAARAGRLIVTWALVEPCLWRETPLAGFQPLHDLRRPLSALKGPQRESEIVRIVGALRQLLDQRRTVPPAAGRDRRPADTPTDIEALAAAPFVGDRSVANGSSIAFLAEHHDKALLVAGDAYADVLCESIRSLLSARGGRRLRLDAFVVAHNGSARNLNRELLELIECGRYLISTDGSKFRHPDRETISRILAFGRAEPDRPLTLVFNYRTQSTAVWDNPELKMRWNYQALYPTVDGGGIKVRI